MRETSAAQGLAAVVGSGHVLSDPEVTAGYGRDLTGRYAAVPALVVLPGTADEVAGVLRVCSAAGLPVVPQGGNTGLVGGGVGREGEVVLSLKRLSSLEAVDPFARQVTVDAGVTLASLQAHARSAGLEFAVDHGARSSATIGGMSATNAGGAFAARYGSMRTQVVGLEAVLPSGAVVERLSGLRKDNAGYDLPSLLVGSEGTLAVITRVRVQLVERLPRRVVVLLPLDGMTEAVGLLPELNRLPSLQAVDFLEENGLQAAARHLGIPPPFDRDYGLYLVIECAAQHDPTDELEALADLLGDALLAEDEPGRHRLWSYRDALNETVAALGVPHKLDVSVPVARLPVFVESLRTLVGELTAGTAEVFLFGHLGDGNVHVNVLAPDSAIGSLDNELLELVASLGGSISAEHGVGLLKPRWLSLTRSAGEIEAMRAIKEALDPSGLLSPGRIFASS